MTSIIFRTRESGFTLIELTIVGAIVAILASIALPSYNEYVLRSHRGNARAALLQVSQWLERAATASGTYPICNTVVDPNPPACQVPVGVRTVEGNRYRIDVNSQAGAYALTATPLASQAVDRCAAFTLNQANVRAQLPYGAVLTPLTAIECWQR
jgi:type IV pilus assembly protein PilE